ncbi:MAG: hypothetical protein AB7O24_01590 [Kofleriaceae bacterium]
MGTSAVRAQLEATVRASWNRDDLAVYADHLQSEGDVRGELIALDLSAPDDRKAPAADEWRERRQDLIAAWVGGPLVSEVERSLWCGFFDKLDERTSSAFLASPAGDYVRAFNLDEDPLADAALHALVSRPRPWLTRLTLRAWRGMALSEELLERVVVATPNLVELELNGRLTLAGFEHPSVERLRIVDLALDTLGPEGLRCPSVTELAIIVPPGAQAGWYRRTLITAERFPALRTLDLSRNRNALWGDRVTPALAMLGHQPIGAQIEQLHAPALASQEDVGLLDRALEAMPRISAVTVAQTYGRPAVGGELTKRWPMVVIPVAFPWPEELAYGMNLAVDLQDGTGGGYAVSWPMLREYLEASFHGFTDAQRTAWTRICEQLNHYIDDRGREPPMVDLDTVVSAVESCTGLASSRCPGWSELRNAIRHIIPYWPPNTKLMLRIGS